MKARLRTHIAALMLLAPTAAVLVAGPAVAQQRVATSITSMALNSDGGLAPGATLRFQLYATPGARAATLQLGDSGIRTTLREQTRGNYTGSYIVRRGDRIDPLDVVTARVTHGGTTIARTFSYPPAFQALAMGAAPAPAPEIERFVLRARGGIQPGNELRFRLVGAPGADAWVDIPGIVRGLDLAEVRPGVYQGSYTVRRRDDPRALEQAVATLESGRQRVTARAVVREDDDDRYGDGRRY